MNEELQKTIKKYNKIYVIELFVVAAIVIVLATLKLVGIIPSSQNFRHVFNIITLVGATYIIADFVWLCFSKKRQKRNSWFDKLSIIPFALAIFVFDIICLAQWNAENIEYFTIFVVIAFYYIAAIYIAQGLYHIKKPSPAIVISAMEEYNDKIENEKKQKETSKSQEENNINDLISSVLKEGSSVEGPLLGGMMNMSYIVKDKDNKRYVLYISTKQANEMVDRPLEKEHQQIIYDLGITSKNIFFDTEKGIKINEFIEGTSIDKINEFDYQKIAELFHKLHSSKILSKTDYNPFSRFINNYEKEANSFSKGINPLYMELRSFLFKHKDYLEKQDKVLSHNDAQRSNIVKDTNDNYFFIDFEFVGNNDEIYDIATFGNGDVNEGRKLLDYYFVNPTLDQIKRYYLWRIYVSLQWYNVAIVKHYRGEGKAHGFDFLKVAEFFLNNADTAYKGYKKEIK